MIIGFKTFLENKRVSPLTQKNYLSDVRYYLKWVKESGLSGKSRKAETLEIPWFNQTLINNFKRSLIPVPIPPTTINRRLSALRQFGEFLVKQGWITENPGRKISGISSKSGISRNEKKKLERTLEQFRQTLKNQKQKEATIKNYLGDIRQFLLFSSREN